MGGSPAAPNAQGHTGLGAWLDVVKSKAGARQGTAMQPKPTLYQNPSVPAVAPRPVLPTQVGSNMPAGAQTPSLFQ